MKLMHLSDLHLGKSVNGFSMTADQKYILNEIADIAAQESPDGILIAGDIYDKQIPSAEAVDLFDDFLVKLAGQGQQVFLISGNHDSPERLSFAGRLIEPSGVHIAPVFQGEVRPYTLEDSYGKVNLYLLPFIKPAHVRRFFDDRKIENYTDALQTMIESMHVNPAERNILVTHQFVAGSERSDSEDILVGGTEQVDPSVFDAFDYTALGHLHKAQKAGRDFVRYCGTPLKYSFSEAEHEKSVTIVELEEKGKLKIRTVKLHPVRDLVRIRGKYEEIVQKSFYENTGWQEDYVHITLTDENPVLNAVPKLRVIYRNLMKLEYDNTRTRHATDPKALSELKTQEPGELFAQFYELQNGVPMSEEQQQYMDTLIREIWEDAV